MLEPQAVIVASVITSFITFLCVWLAWQLNNISSESKQRRDEMRKSLEYLESKYVNVLKVIELCLRSSKNSDLTNDLLSESSAIISLCSNKTVTDAYENFSNSFSDYVSIVKSPDRSNRPLHLYSDQFKVEWNKLDTSKKSLAVAMKKHLSAMDKINRVRVVDIMIPPHKSHNQ